MEWFMPMCAAVEAAHRRGIVHRDLKPENVMLKETPEGIIVKVVDFGLAKLATGDTGQSAKLSKTGDIMGTPQYMAPELFDAETADARADIYALGIIFYEMITGNTPFTGTIQNVISGHILKDPKPVAEVNPVLATQNVALDEVIGLALKKKRDERIGSALEFANALRNVIQGAVANRQPAILPSNGVSGAVSDRISSSNIATQKSDEQINRPTHDHSVSQSHNTVGKISPRETEKINITPGAVQVSGQQTVKGDSLTSFMNASEVQQSLPTTRMAAVEPPVPSSPPAAKLPIKLVAGIASGLVVVGLGLGLFLFSGDDNVPEKTVPQSLTQPIANPQPANPPVQPPPKTTGKTDRRQTSRPKDPVVKDSPPKETAKDTPKDTPKEPRQQNDKSSANKGDGLDDKIKQGIEQGKVIKDLFRFGKKDKKKENN